MVWVENTDNTLSPVKYQKSLFLSTLTQLFINFRFLSFLSSRGLNLCMFDTLKTRRWMRYEILFVPRIYMTDMTSLISFVLYYFILQLFRIFVVMININKTSKE